MYLVRSPLAEVTVKGAVFAVVGYCFAADDVGAVGKLPCAFHTRCPLAQDICRTDRPDLIEDSPRHWSACHLKGNTP
jgi:hypothetical protein